MIPKMETNFNPQEKKLPLEKKEGDFTLTLDRSPMEMTKGKYFISVQTTNEGYFEVYLNEHGDLVGMPMKWEKSGGGYGSITYEDPGLKKYYEKIKKFAENYFSTEFNANHN